MIVPHLNELAEPFGDIWREYRKALILTLIAQQLFQPAVIDEEEAEALGAEDDAVIHRRGTPSSPGTSH